LTTPAPLKSLKMHVRLVILHLRLLLRAMAKSARLPPGRLILGDRVMNTDQLFVAKKVEVHGPVFKTMWNDQYTTCIYGNDRMRRLLVENDDTFPGATIDLKGLFAIGALRGMKGEEHKKYRRLLVVAFQATPLSLHETAVRAWIHDRLDAMSRASADHVVAGPALRVGLRDIASGIMLRFMYGLEPGTPEYVALVADYRILGPLAPVYQLAPENAEAFRRIRPRIERLAEQIRRGPADSFPPSYLKHLVETDSLDETVLGNLIYLHETSHFDFLGLWRWVLHMLATHPQIVARVQAASGESSRELCEAIVYETIRLEQVEELYRTPTADVVFEGCLIPKGTVIRGRLWESHKDSKTFPDPFAFKPDRFIGQTYTIEQFAPFGLDKRRCAGANFVIELSTLFVETVLNNFSMSLAHDGPSFYGAYHWEPAPDFAITLAARQASTREAVPA
jgi:cytochrome P450